MSDRKICYRVLLNGRNFTLKVDGHPERMGFYTTRFVEASGTEEAENRAVELIRDDPTLRDVVLNPRDDPPMVFVDEIEEVSALRPAAGYTFYRQDDGDTA
jgi:hypothetical protein